MARNVFFVLNVIPYMNSANYLYKIIFIGLDLQFIFTALRL